MPIYFYTGAPSWKYRIIVGAISLLQSKTAVQRDLVKNKFPIPSYDIYKSILKSKIKKTTKIESFEIHHITHQDAKPTIVIYLHGGGYVSGSMKIHYDFINKLIDELKIQVIIPDYPLAPSYTYQKTIQMIEESYFSVLQEYPDHQIILMGDSAGGGLALALYLKLKQADKPLPNKIIAISPCVDVALDHPEISDYLKIEPILKDLDGIQKISEIYAEGDYQNPLVSPCYGDFSGIQDLSIFIGTNDILYPDCEKFRLKLEQSQIPNNFFIYQNMCHCWMLYNDFEESRHAFEHISNLLKEQQQEYLYA